MEVDWGARAEAAALKSCGVQASFDEYLQDRARVFRAMFPDESRSQRIGDVCNPITPHALPRSVDFFFISPFAESIG